jgi:hypothetical protein
MYRNIANFFVTQFIGTRQLGCGILAPLPLYIREGEVSSIDPLELCMPHLFCLLFIAQPTCKPKEVLNAKNDF